MTKRIVLALVIAVVSVGSSARVHASEALKAIVESYLEIHAQLAADRTDTIKAQTAKIGEQAGHMGSRGDEIGKAAATLQKAADLNAAREAFGPLSEAIVAAGKAEGWKDVGDVKLAFCPMVKKTWLQKGDTLQNPYYGKSMSNCGEFKKLQ